jgi:nucleoside-diphosphate-sugar epimerase
VHLTHLSSGCIYAGDNGGRGFTEEDAPNFFGSFYSRTKAWSDQMCRDFEHFPNGGGVLTLRLRMPFDGTDAPRNLLTKLKNYTRVLDAENSLTCIPDFLTAAQHLITQRNTGIFNIVNEGTISPYRIMELYREIVDPAHHFERLIVQDLPGVTKAGRSNCVLSTVKLAAQGFALRPVEAAVREALEQIAGRS